jgi:low affinity Fe/Cu permease
MSSTNTNDPLEVGAPRKNGDSAWHQWFSWFARETARLAGSPVTFLGAVLLIVVWAVTGPIFHYSDTWQLVINTGTTIITFLMVFLIQNTQNRDSLAVQLKLSELILAAKGAENRLADAEELSDQELEHLHEEFRRRASSALDTLNKRRAALGEARSSGKSRPHRRHHE